MTLLSHLDRMISLSLRAGQSLCNNLPRTIFWSISQARGARQSSEWHNLFPWQLAQTASSLRVRAGQPL